MFAKLRWWAYLTRMKKAVDLVVTDVYSAPRLPLIAEDAWRVILTSLQRGEAWQQAVLKPRKHSVHRVGACQLFPSEKEGAYFLKNKHMETFLVDLFDCVAFICDARLTRFDLFHAHLFYNHKHNALGVLFHAKEYPARNEQMPYDLGYCQHGSDLEVCCTSMKRRNVIWMFEKDGLALIEPVARAPFFTVFEDELGVSVADFFYFTSGVNQGLHVVPFR